jgi:Zn-dependent protease
LIHGRIRRLVLSRFPYAVYFREQGAEILVIALHGRQDPPGYVLRRGRAAEGLEAME